jgi:hypothetical protein
VDSFSLHSSPSKQPPGAKYFSAFDFHPPIIISAALQDHRPASPAARTASTAYRTRKYTSTRKKKQRGGDQDIKTSKVDKVVTKTSALKPYRLDLFRTPIHLHSLSRAESLRTGARSTGLVDLLPSAQLPPSCTCYYSYTPGPLQVTLTLHPHYTHTILTHPSPPTSCARARPQYGARYKSPARPGRNLRKSPAQGKASKPVRLQHRYAAIEQWPLPYKTPTPLGTSSPPSAAPSLPLPVYHRALYNTRLLAPAIYYP